MSEELNDEYVEETQSEAIASQLESEVAESEAFEKEQADKAQADQESADRQKKHETAFMIALQGVQWLSATVENNYPCVRYDDNTKIEVANKAAAVLAKYDLQMPPWLAAFKEEIELGLVLGTVAFSSYVQIQKWKKEQAAEQLKGVDDDGSQSQQRPIE